MNRMAKAALNGCLIGALLLAALNGVFGAIVMTVLWFKEGGVEYLLLAPALFATSCGMFGLLVEFCNTPGVD